MIHFSLTLMSDTEAPDRKAIADMLRMVARRVERPGWEGGTLMAANLTGLWSLTMLDLDTPSIDVTVAVAVAAKEAHIRAELGYCAWCEEARSPTYLDHQGHDDACPMAPR